MTRSLKIDPDTYPKLVERYEQGRSIRVLARDLGCSYGAVHKALTAAGAEFRSRGGAPLNRQQKKA
ncbi:helix-turn-helix domain-containing protein [Streptomyces sp. 5.8]|uniref:helix-turn-helix domain-containing protein n=1 Tax=Streptomyces sp. 5.8 TaxID=3406571 RepID=UPI003BB6D088